MPIDLLVGPAFWPSGWPAQEINDHRPVSGPCLLTKTPETRIQCDVIGVLSEFARKFLSVSNPVSVLYYLWYYILVRLFQLTTLLTPLLLAILEDWPYGALWKKLILGKLWIVIDAHRWCFNGCSLQENTLILHAVLFTGKLCGKI